MVCLEFDGGCDGGRARDERTHSGHQPLRPGGLLCPGGRAVCPPCRRHLHLLPQRPRGHVESEPRRGGCAVPSVAWDGGGHLLILEEDRYHFPELVHDQVRALGAVALRLVDGHEGLLPDRSSDRPLRQAGCRSPPREVGPRLGLNKKYLENKILSQPLSWSLAAAVQEFPRMMDY